MSIIENRRPWQFTRLASFLVALSILGVRLACQTRIDGDVALRRLVQDDADIEITSLFVNGHGVNTIIEKHGGFIDNYMGDGLMALFESKDPFTGAFESVRAGIGMLREVKERCTTMRTGSKTWVDFS